MVSPRVSFLAFNGCPLAPRARSNLRAAISVLEAELPVEFEEIDLLGDTTSEEVSRWGSPTILINGFDLMGLGKGDACGCRIYSSEGGVPTTNEILSAIRKVSKL